MHPTQTYQEIISRVVVSIADGIAGAIYGFKERCEPPLLESSFSIRRACQVHGSIVDEISQDFQYGFLVLNSSFSLPCLYKQSPSLIITVASKGVLENTR
jgi:hypothetical protein